MKQSPLPLILASAIALAACKPQVSNDTVVPDEPTVGAGDTSGAMAGSEPNNTDMMKPEDKAAMGNMSAGDNMSAGAATGNNSAATMPAKTPTITKTTTYRCDDKSVLKVDYMSDEISAIVRADGEAPTLLKAERSGGPMTAESGARLSGSGAEIAYRNTKGKTVGCKG